MTLVIASAIGFLASLVLNAFADIRIAWQGAAPALPHVLDQRLVAFELWCFLIPAIWGFNSRWLPVFLGLPASNGRLFGALCIAWAGAVAEFSGASMLSAVLPFGPPRSKAFIRVFHDSCHLAYGWLLIGSGLWLAAALADHSGGIWGAARHALTVGYISAMVFAIGQRVLPAFGGMRRLYSPRLMLASLAALMVGCALRVAAEIPAYEGYSHAAWHVLPCSAVIELIAVSLFAANIVATFLRPPAHLQGNN